MFYRVIRTLTSSLQEVSAVMTLFRAPRFRSAAFAALLVFSASTADAAIDAAGAEALKKEVTDALSLQAAMLKNTGNGIETAGDVTVTPKGDFYEISIPGLAYNFGQGEDVAKFAVGTVLVNAVPGQAGEYVVSMKLPSPIPVKDAAGATIAEIGIGNQKLSAAWRPDLDSFTKLASEYSDITIKMMKKMDESELSGTITSLKSTIDLSEAGEQTWSGPKTFEVNGIKLSLSGRDNGTFNIDRVVSTSTYDRMNLKAESDVRRQVLDMVKGGTQPTAEAQKALFDQMMQNMNKMGDGITSNSEVSGIKVDVTPGKDPNMPTKDLSPLKLSLEKASTKMVFKGLSSDIGNAGMGLSLNGLNIASADPATAGLIPFAANVDIALDKLPMKELNGGFAGLMQELMSSTIATEKAAGTVYEAQHKVESRQKLFTALATIPQLLANAGSTLTVSNTYTKANDMSTTLDGKFTASATAQKIAAGQVTLNITGMDETVARMQAESQKPGASPKFAGAAQMLTLVQAQGQLGKGADGKSLRTYKLEVLEDGRVTLNGIDLSMLLGIMGGGMANPVAPVPAPAPNAPAPEATP